MRSVIYVSVLLCCHIFGDKDVILGEDVAKFYASLFYVFILMDIIELAIRYGNNKRKN